MIDLVAGTRPNFMKVAPIWRELEARGIPARLIHTGQHFDPAMSDVFFRDLGLPSPNIRFQCGGGTHAEQTAAVLVAVERVFLESRPDVVVVVGDVTSTLATALAASKLGVPIAHVEAGLRSRDWSMPEEINRVVTDQLSDLLLTPSADAERNLLAEGIPQRRVRFVGNVMIDSLHWARRTPTDAVARNGLHNHEYALVTLHRPVNVDTPGALESTFEVIRTIARRLPVLFPIHPRTVARIASSGMHSVLTELEGVVTCEPLGYNDFVTLMENARLVATDSGGIQEETTALGVPCLTLRVGTERPITVEQGTNIIVGLDTAKISREVDAVMAGQPKRGTVPEGWDGRASERVVTALVGLLNGEPETRAAVRAKR